jgi:hypothetical protein
VISARDIWFWTVVTMVVATTAALSVALLGENLAGGLSEPMIFWTLVAPGAIATILRVWSIGLLFRREFDLYMIALASWLALTGIRSSSGVRPPTTTEFWIVLCLGLALDVLQMWAFWQAFSRARAKDRMVSP